MMRSLAAFTDRMALLSLALLATLHVLFFLAFLASLLAAGRAHAEQVAGTGRDMVETLRRDDPDAYAGIVAEAARTANGKGLLWKLEKAGTAPSYLFGTMHMTDPRVTTLPASARAAFDAAGTVVIETTDILDQAAMMAALAKEPELMMFTDGTTLASLLSPDDAATMNRELDARGIPPASVARMKPWMLAAMVALPACELARKTAGAPVLDVMLAEDAKAAGKDLRGLETAADQLHAMASLPMDLHMKGLVDTLKLGARLDDVNETMIDLYRRGDIGMIWPLFRAVLPEDDDGYAAFEEAMVTRRNATMAERAAPLLARGDVFIAVGALHLPGPDGLVEKFRTAGYTVSHID